MKLKFLLSIVFFAFFSTLSYASEWIFTQNFNYTDISFEKSKGYDRVKLLDGRFSAESGTPLLPVKFVQIAIPADSEVEEVKVISFESQELFGTYNIYPAQKFLPLSEFPTKDEKVEFVEPNPLIYDMSSEYPGKLVQVTNNGFLGGQHIAGVALYPVQYIPSEGKLMLYTHIEFELIFKRASHFATPVNRRSTRGVKFYSDLAKSIVINPEEVIHEPRGYLPLEEEVDYLIITHDSLASTFQELATWKIQKGISTQIRGLFWILSNYEGCDEKEKIRNCIRNYYSNHGTRWVLLGGDTPILPHRVAPMMGENIPCDLYYSDLDSNWDRNGNHIYGEYEDSVDMYPDVFVGRAPCNSVSQAETFVSKCLRYETNPPTDYQRRILYAAEMVWRETDAAELKDYIDVAFVPDYFETTKLYETSGNLNKETFEDSMNKGYNIINHCGHGSYDRLSIGSYYWYSYDMDGLVNGPDYSFFYTYSCYSASIDKDCIGEHFVNHPTGGGIGYCGNSREGWGVAGYPLEGPGAEFDIEFFRALFDSSTYLIGKTLGHSKIPFIPISQQSFEGGPYYRWTMFALLLLGDPTLELWTDIPAELYVDHSSVIFSGMNFFEVNVSQDNALVCCSKDGQVLGTAYSSGGNALVYLDPPPTADDTMCVTVTKHNSLPYQDTVLVIPSQVPYVIHQSHQIDDSSGNDNGVLNPGETISMSLIVKNVGIQTAYGVTATLREEDNFITITDSLKNFGNIDSGMTAQGLGDYLFEIDPFCPDSHLVTFALEATDNESLWISSFYEMVVEPDFIITAIPEQVTVHQGDSTEIKLIFTSFGGFHSQVDLSYWGMPPGVNGILNPDQLIPTDSSILRIYANPTALPGLYPVTIVVSGGGIIREKEVMLSVLRSGKVWYVSTSGDDPTGEGSEENPFKTIQRGIDVAVDRDTVLVENGIYQEKIDFSGKAILVASHYIFSNWHPIIQSTVIHGNNSGRVVTFKSGEDSNSVIRGFTITGGNAEYGGGIYCRSSSPTISDNFVVGNESYWNKGGPAVFCLYGSNPRIHRNLIFDNTGPAAILLIGNSKPQIVNNTICGNSWGGLSIQDGSAPHTKNNIFYDNNLYGISGTDATWGEILYNDVYAHENNYYVTVSDQTGINGNISAHPIFVDSTAGYFHLSTGSPCIDSGDPADSIPTGGGDRVDMGAFEFIPGPYLLYLSHQIDDSSENNNSKVDPGEDIFMPVTLSNGGSETAYNISGTLRANDDFILVKDSVKNFGDIQPGMTGTSTEAFRFEVDPSCTSSHQWMFTLEATDGENLWLFDFSESISELNFVMTLIPDTVLITPGDEDSIKLVFISEGGFDSQVNLSCADLPSEVSGVFVPGQLVPPDTSTFSIYPTSEASCRAYPLSLTAMGGDMVHHQDLILVIYISGDANGDELVSLADAVYLVNYLFKNGAPPVPILKIGDFNCDGNVDIVDVIYLVNYLFKSGPPPCI